MIDANSVFDAVRRDYRNLHDASASEILEYFKHNEESENIGHISNIKGIVFEQEITDALAQNDIHAEMFEAVNHPLSDIAIFDESDNIVGEFQLKATDSVAYISDTIDNNPEIPIITTSEVASHFSDVPTIIDSGITNEGLTEAVTNCLLNDPNFSVDIYSAGDSVSDELFDSVSDSILPVPVSKVGLVITLIKYGLGIVF